MVVVCHTSGFTASVSACSLSVASNLTSIVEGPLGSHTVCVCVGGGGGGI